MMAGTNRTEEEDPARRIARLAGSLHKGVSEHGRKKDKLVKESALHLLALCSERYDAVSGLVRFLHSRVANDIGRKDRGEAALDALIGHVGFR